MPAQSAITLVTLANLASADFAIDIINKEIELRPNAAVEPLNSGSDTAVIRQQGQIVNAQIAPIVIDVNGVSTIVGYGFKAPTLADLPPPDVDITNIAGDIVARGWGAPVAPHINTLIDGAPTPVYGLPYAVGDMTAVQTNQGQTVAFVANP